MHKRDFMAVLNFPLCSSFILLLQIPGYQINWSLLFVMNCYSSFGEILYEISLHEVWRSFRFLAIFTSYTKHNLYDILNGLLHVQVYHKLVHRCYWTLVLYIITFLKYAFCSFYLIHFTFCWNAVYKPVGSKFNKFQGTFGNFVYFIMEYAVSSLISYLMNGLMFCFHDCFRE